MTEPLSIRESLLRPEIISEDEEERSEEDAEKMEKKKKRRKIRVTRGI